MGISVYIRDGFGLFLSGYDIIKLSFTSIGVCECPESRFTFLEASVGCIQFMVFHQINKKITISVCVATVCVFAVVWSNLCVKVAT